MAGRRADPGPKSCPLQLGAPNHSLSISLLYTIATHGGRSEWLGDWQTQGRTLSLRSRGLRIIVYPYILASQAGGGDLIGKETDKPWTEQKKPRSLGLSFFLMSLHSGAPRGGDLSGKETGTPGPRCHYFPYIVLRFWRPRGWAI